MTNSPALKKIISARSKIVIKASTVFFGHIALRLSLQEDNRIRTMAVDGFTMYYNTKFVESLTPDELHFVILHEIMHVALGHIPRLKGRDHEIFNVACDYVINSHLVNMMKLTMPTTTKGLLDPKYDGMSAEQVYDLIKDNYKKIDIPGFGEFMFPKSDSTMELEAKLEEIKHMVNEVTKEYGKHLDESTRRKVLDCNETLHCWEEVLNYIVSNIMKHDYTWSKLNRKLYSQGIYIPSLISSSISHVTLIIDTSGSIDNVILSRFIAEGQNIFDSYTIEELTIMYADSVVRKIDQFKYGETLKMDPAGGGGTSFTDSFRIVREQYEHTKMVIYFTDMEVNEWGQEPNCPVIWAQYGNANSKPPFGRIVKIK